jgi:hypothetical protein
MLHRNHTRIASGPLQNERLAVRLRVSTGLAPVATNQLSCCGHRARKDVFAESIEAAAKDTRAGSVSGILGLMQPHSFTSSPKITTADSYDKRLGAFEWGLKRRSRAVGQFPDRQSALRLLGTIAIQVTAKWAERRYWDITQLRKEEDEKKQHNYY